MWVVRSCGLWPLRAPRGAGDTGSVSPAPEERAVRRWGPGGVRASGKDGGSALAGGDQMLRVLLEGAHAESRRG